MATKATTSKKTAKEKSAAKVAGAIKPRVVGQDHNQVIPAAKDCLDRIISFDDKIKELNKAKRDERAKLKTDFGISSSVVMHELRLRKMDKDVRIQFESGHHDFKLMLGYQQELDLAEDTVARTEEEFVDPNDPDAEVNHLAKRGH